MNWSDVDADFAVIQSCAIFLALLTKPLINIREKTVDKISSMLKINLKSKYLQVENTFTVLLISSLKFE